MPFVRVNGVRLYYETAGDHGQSIVLIHGSWGDHRNWDAVVPALAREFRVTTYDRRGHSQSERPPTQGSFDEDALDALGLMEELGLLPAHAVGNSGGASIALKLAAREPSALRSLTVHEPPLFGLLAEDPTTAPLLEVARSRIGTVSERLASGDPAGGARLFAESVAFGPGGWDRLGAAMQATFISNADTFLDETRDATGLVVDLATLSRFERPALLTHGGASPPMFLPVIRKLARAIPHARVEAYPDDGHVPHVTNPGEFARRTAAFAGSVH